MASLRAVAIEIAHDLLHAVIGLRDRRRGERVCRDDIRPGLKIGEVDVADGIGLRQDQEIVVAADILLPIGEALPAKLRFVIAQALDHRAHCAVEDEDALARGGFEFLANSSSWRYV